jgi:hypothetical protein
MAAQLPKNGVSWLLLIIAPQPMRSLDSAGMSPSISATV